jgi:hypothetical protein
MDGDLIAFYSLDSFHTSTTFVDKFPSGIWIIHLGIKPSNLSLFFCPSSITFPYSSIAYTFSKTLKQ